MQNLHNERKVNKHGERTDFIQETPRRDEDRLDRKGD